jgi:hypothetical protein
MAVNINGSSIGQPVVNGRSTPVSGGAKRKDKLDISKLYAYYDREKKSIADFVSEYQTVSNYDYYKNTQEIIDYRKRLMDLYDYSMLDLHLTSIVDSLFHQIIGERYSIKNADGSTNEEATKLIKNSWFVSYIRGVIESKLYGYTLMELGEIDESTGTLDGVKMIPRRNVAPKNNLVLEYPDDTAGWDITSKRFKGDYVMIDGQEGYGWLLKCIPIVMSKRFAISSHTQYAETYGTPMIVGKTTDDSFEEKKELANEIAAARDSRVIVAGIEDDITFLNQISNDTNKIYTELVGLANDEMTMLILGQSATTKSQAYVGSAEIQYRVMVDRVEAVREFVENHINEDLLWRLREKGLNISEDATFKYSNVMEMSPESKRDLFGMLLGSYEISQEEIYDTFGVTVGRQILEESNDQLLTYGEGTVKERGNPDNAESKSATTEQNLEREDNRNKKLKENYPDKASPYNPNPKVDNGINFFDSIAGCDLDASATPMDVALRKLDSKALSDIDVIKTLNKTYSSHHSHDNDVVASLEDDVNEFEVILATYLSDLFSGDEEALANALRELTQAQYNKLSEVFEDSYGVALESLSGSDSEEGYKNSVQNFFSSFSASKQYKLLMVIASLADTYSEDYATFVIEAKKANSLFNKTYHVVEGEVSRTAYEFANVWRSETDDQVIFQYGTAGDERVRADHAALDGIRMRKSEWATSSFLPPWAYGCRCYLFNTGTTDGRQLTNSRKLPSEDIVPAEFRINTGETGSVFSRQHPYYTGLTQGDAVFIRQAIANVNK